MKDIFDQYEKLKLSALKIDKNNKIEKVSTYKVGMFEDLIKILDFFVDNTWIDNYIFSGVDILSIVIGDNESFYIDYESYFDKNTIIFYTDLLNIILVGDAIVDDEDDLVYKPLVNYKKFVTDSLNNGDFIYNGVDENDGGVGYFKNDRFDINNILDIHLKVIVEQSNEAQIELLKTLYKNKKNKYISASDHKGEISFKVVNIDWIISHVEEYSEEIFIANARYIKDDIDEARLKHLWNVK
jgi:hypothetical protein